MNIALIIIVFIFIVKNLETNYTNEIFLLYRDV